MPQPWDNELKSAKRSVEPQAQARVAKRLFKVVGDAALDYERAASSAAGGKQNIYMALVQQLLRDPTVTLGEYTAWCRRSDRAQTKLSHINDRRNRVLARIRQARFEVPEVPETKETNRKCRCGSTDVVGGQRQTRSADEAMTVIYTCQKCKAEFR